MIIKGETSLSVFSVGFPEALVTASGVLRRIAPDSDPVCGLPIDEQVRQRKQENLLLLFTRLQNEIRGRSPSRVPIRRNGAPKLTPDLSVNRQRMFADRHFKAIQQISKTLILK